MAQAAPTRRGGVYAATEDLSALTTSGEDLDVLAFALGSCPGRVVDEELNQAETMTFVYRADGADARPRSTGPSTTSGSRSRPPRRRPDRPGPADYLPTALTWR